MLMAVCKTQTKWKIRRRCKCNWKRKWSWSSFRLKQAHIINWFLLLL